MKKDEIISFTFTMLGICLCVVLIHSEPAFDLTPENLWKYIALALGMMMVCVLSLMGSVYSATLRAIERKKKGLRPEWHFKDMDELEERVKKLEEKKDPEK